MTSKENISEEKIKEYTKRLLLSRMRILDKHGFYGIMLMHVKFKLDLNCSTAYTDSLNIAFSTSFLEGLSDKELDFVLMHEIMHIALKHCFRGVQYDPLVFNIATDIVVNSNILKSNDMDLNSISLNNHGPLMHLINNQEGFLYTAEEVYQMLLNDKDIQNYLKNKQKIQDELDELDKLEEQDDDDDEDDVESDDNGPSIPGLPYDPNSKFNVKGKKKHKGLGGKFGKRFDDHSKWKKKDNNQERIDEINKQVSDAAASAKNRDPGSVPLGIEREIDKLLHPTVDWRSVLNDFVQQEVNDYSFNPPDKRYDSSGFFLPDYNETSETIDKILFMIDTSGSVNYEELSQAYAEIKGAIEQFTNIKGYLGFFDSVTYPPIEFDSVQSLMEIKPVGGGGTNFHSIFDYIKNNMADDLPKSVIIITDGYAPFPTEEECLHLPILWLINNDVMTPLYGKVIRFNQNE